MAHNDQVWSNDDLWPVLEGYIIPHFIFGGEYGSRQRPSRAPSRRIPIGLDRLQRFGLAQRASINWIYRSLMTVYLSTTDSFAATCWDHHHRLIYHSNEHTNLIGQELRDSQHSLDTWTPSAPSVCFHRRTLSTLARNLVLVLNPRVLIR